MLVLTDEQKVSLSIEPKTAAGNPARIDGAVHWEVSDTNVLSIEVSEDTFSAVVTAIGPLGTAQVVARADADLDEDEFREIMSTLDIEVVAAEAASLGIVAGVPELK